MEILLFLVNEIVLYNIYTYMYIYAYMQKEKLLIRESSKAWKFQTSASSFQRGPASPIYPTKNDSRQLEWG